MTTIKVLGALAVRDMTAAQGLHMPNESAEYRTARDALLREEIELRRHLERVAAQRRALPPGGKAIDYEFVGEDGPIRLSQMFEPGKDSLVTYAWMFGPERDNSCPSCAAFLDGLDGAAPHVMYRANLAVIARGPIERLVLTDPGEHPRHNGTLDLLWNVLDLTPEGRGGDWGPKLEYP